MSIRELLKTLVARKVGGGWMAPCPAHDDQTPSLSIRIGNHAAVLVRCHAGCEQQTVIDALRARRLWQVNGRRSDRRILRGDATNNERHCQNPIRTKAALAIWESSMPAAGTLVDAYFQSRGLTLAPPPSLRVHPCLKHRSGGIWPTMVALVTAGKNGAPMGFHRTFLDRNGVGKAPVEPQKMMLGPCKGGAVRLATPGEVLMIGEACSGAGEPFRRPVPFMRWTSWRSAYRCASPHRHGAASHRRGQSGG